MVKFRAAAGSDARAARSAWLRITRASARISLAPLLVAQIMANDAQHEALIGELLYPGDTQKAVPYGLVQGVQ